MQPKKLQPFKRFSLNKQEEGVDQFYSLVHFGRPSKKKLLTENHLACHVFFGRHIHRYPTDSTFLVLLLTY